MRILLVIAVVCFILALVCFGVPTTIIGLTGGFWTTAGLLRNGPLRSASAVGN